MQIKGGTFIVTGGASGLGEGTAKMLAEAGANVVIADLQADKGEALARQLGAKARFARHVAFDEARLCPELPRERLALVGLKVGDDDVRAGFGEHLGGSFAEARGAAGDDEGAAFDLHGLSPKSSSRPSSSRASAPRGRARAEPDRSSRRDKSSAPASSRARRARRASCVVPRTPCRSSPCLPHSRSSRAY